MPAAELADNEDERLAALIALGLSETGQNEGFEIFPALASTVFSVPMAAVCFVEQDRQWFKASVGLSFDETPREVSFCAHAILNPAETLCIPDATKDVRFSDSQLVTGTSGVRFYAGAPVIGPSGHAIGALCVMDTVPREASEAELRQLGLLAQGVGCAVRLHASVQQSQRHALIDPLTGLANRAGFDRSMRDRLGRRTAPAPAPAPAAGTGLLVVGLDGFKSVNELFGHDAGDAVLREVGGRLRRTARVRDTIGRVGGDEFAILIDNLDNTADLSTLAGRIHAAIADPFIVEQQAITIHASIGGAFCSVDMHEPEGLVRCADNALQEAKRAGPGSTRLCSMRRFGQNTLRSGRRAVETSLRQALLPPGREPFTLAVQSVVHARTGAVTGFEALVRWPGPRNRVRQPADFIPVAEATGLVVQLDRWVLDQACRLATTWPDDLRISSNLSAANFFAGNLVDHVRGTLARHCLAPDRLKLEITETVLLQQRERVQRIIAELRALGVHVVLDDFGAGHASLAYLRDYAFDGLKIDRSLIADLTTDGRSRAFVGAIVDMAGALNLETTAEGIETEDQLHCVRSMGVTTVQGYMLGRPVAPEQAPSLYGRAAYAAVG